MTNKYKFYGAGNVALWEKLLLGYPPYLTTESSPTTWLQMQPPAYACCEAVDTVSSAQVSSVQMETWVEFLAPGFSLAQVWLLLALGGVNLYTGSLFSSASQGGEYK